MVVIHRHLVVVVRAVWRCMVYDGGVVEGGACGLLDGSMVSDGSTVVDVSVADFWREKHDGMEVRWGNEGAWWSGLVLK